MDSNSSPGAEGEPAPRAADTSVPPPPDARFLAGRTALVTGAAGGIGRACALALAEAGAEVYVVDRAADGAKEVAALIGGTCVVADLADADAVDALPADADIVVNNAGL